MLTYIIAVSPPRELNENLVDEPVVHRSRTRRRVDPPPEIDVTQVLEHAFRHLAWLVKTMTASVQRFPTGWSSSTRTSPTLPSVRPATYLSRYPEPSASTMVHMVASVAVVPAMAVESPYGPAATGPPVSTTNPLTVPLLLRAAGPDRHSAGRSEECRRRVLMRPV